MNYKKLVFDIIIIVIAFIIFISWHDKKFDAIPTSSLDKTNIYLITMDKTDRYWYDVDKGARDMALMLGVNYRWDAPEPRSAEEQTRIINNAVEAGAEAILLAAVDPIAISSAVEDAKARGVEIIYVDAPANEEATTTLATDNYAAGRLAGNTMIEELEAAGLPSGSIGIIGVTPVTGTTLERERGFRDVLLQNGNYTLLDTAYIGVNPENAITITEGIVRDHPDLVGLFGTNEPSTLSVGRVLREYDGNIIGVGFDITSEIQKMLTDDILKAVLAQNPYTMGYLGMAQAVAAIKGYDTGPPFLDTGVSVLTKYRPNR